MNAMDKLFKLLLAAAAALFFTGCYSDYLNPGPARVYTRADFEAKGLEYISVGELKARFRAENAGMNDGTVASWTVDEPLFTSGKVISTDRFGNVYKSVYLYDEGLVLGNYRGMVSIGTTSYNASYSNDNIESKIMQDEHIFSGEQQPMLKSDTLVVTRDNYRTVLSDDDLGRLVRFEGVESRFGTALWGYKNTFPNYFANSVSYDVNSPGWEDMDQWATWFTYDAQAAGTGTNAAPGNYVVRTSGYSQFRDNKIPVSGSVVDLTAIYTKFTNGSGNYATYQLTLNTDRDVVVK